MSRSLLSNQSPNPYQSPAGGNNRCRFEVDAAEICNRPRLLEALRQTQPWVRYLGVQGFVTTGLLWGLGLLLSLATGRIGPSLVFIVPSLLLLVPSIRLNRYASGIKEFRITGKYADLETALHAQVSYWRFVGTLSVVLMCLSLLLVVAARCLG